jgi:undecaprenyl-diphosphatase
MSLLQSIVLGVVQGVTEFLPISSTAHLRIVPALLGWDDPGAFYSAFIQLGTVAAVMLYFARDLWKITEGALKGIKDRNPFETFDARLAWYIAAGTVPAAVAGLLFKKSIETTLRSLYVISASMVGLAIVLFLAEKVAKHRRVLQELTLKDALVIGCCQAVALIPGSSRSGTTMTGGLWLGFKREDAARFAFLLSIPANVAAAVLEFKRHIHDVDRPSNLMLAAGTLAAFLSGMAVIAWLLHYLRTRTMLVFVVYRLVLGAILFTLLQTGRLSPHEGLTAVERNVSPLRSPRACRGASTSLGLNGLAEKPARD